MSIAFYEKVVVISSSMFPQYTGNTGVVVGISSDDDNVYGYVVLFKGEITGIIFLPEDLIGTKEFARRDEIYDENDRIRVRVDNKRGLIVD